LISHRCANPNGSMGGIPVAGAARARRLFSDAVFEIAAAAVTTICATNRPILASFM
jgi:hypothetical protein